MFQWTNPNDIDLKNPYCYYIRIDTGKHEFRYIGKASNASRLNEYPRNVEKILAGKTRRPILKKDGLPQSRGNLRYRHVHSVLAIAENNGWLIEHHARASCNRKCR